MLKKLNKFMTTSIVLSALLLVIGIVLMFYPSISLKIIFYLIGMGLVISGILFMFSSSDGVLFMSFQSMGVFQIILGVIVLIHPDLLKTLIPILIGIWMVVRSSIDLKLSFVLKDSNYSGWLFVLVLAIISMVCGVIIALNPEISSEAITTAFGIIVASYSITNIVDMAIFKKNINSIAKELKIK